MDGSAVWSECVARTTRVQDTDMTRDTGTREDDERCRLRVYSQRRSVNCDIEVTLLANSRARAALTPLTTPAEYFARINARDTLGVSELCVYNYVCVRARASAREAGFIIRPARNYAYPGASDFVTGEEAGR